MKEGIIDVLMYLMEHYVDEDIPSEPHRSELADQLLEAGFGDTEVTQAFDWLEGLSQRRAAQLFDPASDSLRIYRTEELQKLGVEGIGYLHQLEQNGVLTPGTREQTIERFLALNSQGFDLEQLKWVVLMVLFNQPNEDATSFAWLEELVYDERPLSIH